MSVLLDTNVLRELWHPKGSPKVQAAVAAIDPGGVFISVITIGETAKGIAGLPVGLKRAQISQWLAAIERDFGDRVLPVTSAIARLWGPLTWRVQSRGKPLPVTDGLIAATALHHGLSVMTRNARDFAPAGVTVIDPWTD